MMPSNADWPIGGARPWHEEPAQPLPLTEGELRDLGYLTARALPGGDWLAIQPQLYTIGLFRIGAGDRDGYECRWCYRHLADAIVALGLWDGVGDDPGGPWVKQKGRDSHGLAVDRLNPRLADPEADFGG